jgi:hypothetical protein
MVRARAWTQVMYRASDSAGVCMRITVSLKVMFRVRVELAKRFQF